MCGRFVRGVVGFVVVRFVGGGDCFLMGEYFWEICGLIGG